MAAKEAQARIKINKLLEAAGWRLLDDEHGPANVVLENNVKLTPKEVGNLGRDFETVKEGFVDFLLLDAHRYPLIVLEAKSEDHNPLDGKEQARNYAQAQHARFVILSNGNLHYFWDLEQGNPTVITQFPTEQSLTARQTYRPDPARLADELVQADYVLMTQYPQYLLDPRWIDERQRAELIRERDLVLLRPYQLQAVRALQASFRAGNNRFLFEMATGTGKTLTCAAVVKLFLRTGNATRVLFLVDRLELEDQARKNLDRWLHNDYHCQTYKEHRDEWHKAEIVVSTVQSLTSGDKYMRLFSPTDFDLVISDEAHRSINGNARALFEYFVGAKLGLTATPKDYLKNIDPTGLNQMDPRALERRQLLDTYTTFGCPSGEPTFRYSLVDGVRDGFLVNPIVVDARTEITTQLLSDKGYAVAVTNTLGEEYGQVFFQKDYEKKLFSERTNRMLCETFLNNALLDPITHEIGKSIMFCVSQEHASKMTQILNEMAEQRWPGQYHSDFAVQVTSNVMNAQQYAVAFANNNLNGHTDWLDGYASSRTRVCVTVGMMTTGYDCRDLLNVCLARPIFSPTDFIQIKGRGTRTWTFDGGQDRRIAKEHFKLFDFFANCEYFEEKFNYDEVLKLPRVGTVGETGADANTVIDETVGSATIYVPDPLRTISEMPVGPQGMKIDQKLFEKAGATIRADTDIKQAVEADHWDRAIALARERYEDKPELYLTLERLKEAEKLDRRLTWREVLERMFGRIDRFRTKNELLDDEYAKFIAVTPTKPDARQAEAIRNFMKAYITDAGIRTIIDSGTYSQLAANPKLSMQDLNDLNGWLKELPEYIKNYVSLNTFMQ